MAKTTRARDSYHHGALAAAMVERAFEQVRTGGAERLTLRGVAHDLGVSPSAAYNHFPDKEALLRTVGRRGYALLGARMTEGLAAHPSDSDRDARSRFAALGRAYLDFAIADPHLFRLTFSPLCSGDAPDPTQPGAFQMLHQALDDLDRRGLLRRGVRDGLEMTIWAATHGMANLLVEGVIPPESVDGFLASIERLLDLAD